MNCSKLLHLYVTATRLSTDVNLVTDASACLKTFIGLGETLRRVSRNVSMPAGVLQERRREYLRARQEIPVHWKFRSWWGYFVERAHSIEVMEEAHI